MLKDYNTVILTLSVKSSLIALQNKTVLQLDVLPDPKLISDILVVMVSLKAFPL